MKIKKLKKLIAGVLSAAMVMSTMAVTAFAASEMPTIDTSRTGSLTIHKYEYNGSTLNIDSDGNELTESEKQQLTQAGAQGLDDVTFKVTKIADLEDYYTAEGLALPTVEQAATMAASASPSDIHTVTTANGGVATLTRLQLGLYYVEETDAPDQITGKVAPFLVSIPMTNADGDDWIYDVHVYPKNSSTYAGVTLKKTGKVGNEDKGIVAGAKFVIQRSQNDENTSWMTITKNNKGVSIGTDGVLTTNSSGEISVADLAPGTYRFVETDVPDDTGYIMDGTTTYMFKITTEGKVTSMDDQEISTSPHITATNERPDLHKEVKKGDSWAEAADYSKAEEIEYRITVDVPSNIAKLNEFKLSDTMTNQNYVDGSLKIYSDATLASEILKGQYTVMPSETTGWSISFNSVKETTITSLLADYAGKSVYIYFKAKLTDDAVTTSAGNPNEATLEYSNKIIPTTDDGNPNEEETPGKDKIVDKAVVYTFQIEVNKVDGQNNSPLQNVQFDLYKKLDDSAEGAGVIENPVNGLNGKYEKVNSSPLITNESGKVSVHGLENGTYYLVETKATGDYNLLKEPVQVELAVEYEVTTTKTSVTGVDGITTTTETITNTKYNNAGSNGVFSTTIKNYKGFTLPVTGGAGTLLASLIGILLMGGGAFVFISSRKKKKAE